MHQVHLSRDVSSGHCEDMTGGVVVRWHSGYTFGDWSLAARFMCYIFLLTHLHILRLHIHQSPNALELSLGK